MYINYVQKLCTEIMYRNYVQKLCIEICRNINNLNPEFMKDLFTVCKTN